MSWRLTYPGGDVQFDTKYLVLDQAPEIGDPTRSVGDVPATSGDALLFGRDRTEGRLVTFHVAVLGEGRDDTRARLSELQEAWRGDAVRHIPGAVAVLESDSGRVTFGRPRRFRPDLESDRLGHIAVDCDFQTADDLWYGPEQSTSVSIAPAVGGGLVAPLVAPLATTESSDRSTAVTVGGSLPTWPVFEVRGPISGPVIELVGQWAMRFPNLSLAYDQTLVVDARPWARTILRDGGSVAGMLAQSSARLQDAVLPPGTHELVLRGTSLTGTASLTARWRDAYTTP